MKRETKHFVKGWIFSIVAFVLILIDVIFNDFIFVKLPIFTPIIIIVALVYCWYLDYKMFQLRIAELLGRTGKTL